MQQFSKPVKISTVCFFIFCIGIFVWYKSSYTNQIYAIQNKKFNKPILLVQNADTTNKDSNNKIILDVFSSTISSSKSMSPLIEEDIIQSLVYKSRFDLFTIEQKKYLLNDTINKLKASQVRLSTSKSARIIDAYPKNIQKQIDSFAIELEAVQNQIKTKKSKKR